MCSVQNNFFVFYHRITFNCTSTRIGGGKFEFSLHNLIRRQKTARCTTRLAVARYHRFQFEVLSEHQIKRIRSSLCWSGVVESSKFQAKRSTTGGWQRWLCVNNALRLRDSHGELHDKVAKASALASTAGTWQDQLSAECGHATHCSIYANLNQTFVTHFVFWAEYLVLD